jgi:ABC-type polysaccharide/polyol phosphate transport system ATPase subunit
MAAALVFDGICKDFRGGRRYRALRDDVAGLARGLLTAKHRPRGVVHALTDVSFEVPEGQSMGLIGANGAGKTTALKLATRITYPTRGTLRVRGRVGALIEVGSGLHPELTGRENVHLYGRILGLSGRDIAQRFDEIVEFAGIATAIDQPVKHFSSGMQLRLGFSIAAHIEPDVLLVDEALAVGDLTFQQRCVDHMHELVRAGGTLVFVSHDVGAVERLCERAVLLDRGRVVLDGRADEVVAAYVRSGESGSHSSRARNDAITITRVDVLDAGGRSVDAVRPGDTATFRISFRAERRIERPHFTIGLADPRWGKLASASMALDGGTPSAISGEGWLDCAVEIPPLRPRIYELWLGVGTDDGPLVPRRRTRLLDVRGPAGLTSGFPLRLSHRWIGGPGVEESS